MKVWVIGEKYSWCFCRVYAEKDEKKARKYAKKGGDIIILYDTDTHEELERTSYD